MTNVPPTAARPAGLNEDIHRLLAGFGAPQELFDSIAGAMSRLEATGAAPGLNVGDRAPEFTLPNQLGKPVSLKDELAGGAVVLKFYRGEWCPICNMELRSLQQRLPELRAAGASLVAISPQRPSNALSLSQKLDLDFEVLSDEEQQVIRDYKLLFTVPPEVQEIYHDAFQMDLSEFTADGTWDLPIPATFVVDRDGVIRFRHIEMNYMTRAEPDDVLAAVHGLRRAN